MGRHLAVFDRLGFDVTGIDTNPKEIEYVRSRGFRGVVTSLDALGATGERFDCVLASHLIEHIIDIDAFLRQVSACLAPGGLLLVETPLRQDLGRAEERYRDIYHTLFFDHFTLALAAAKHGFAVRA